MGRRPFPLRTIVQNPRFFPRGLRFALITLAPDFVEITSLRTDQSIGSSRFGAFYALIAAILLFAVAALATSAAAGAAYCNQSGNGYVPGQCDKTNSAEQGLETGIELHIVIPNRVTSPTIDPSEKIAAVTNSRSRHLELRAQIIV